MVGQPVRLQAPSIPPPSTLSTGQRLPQQPLRNGAPVEITLTPGQKKSLFSFSGKQRLVLASVVDDGAGLVKYSIKLDNQTEVLNYPFIWQIVSFLTGNISSNGPFSLLPTGFTASQKYVGYITYLTAMFTTDSSGNVQYEGLTIDDSRIQALGKVEVTAENVGTADATVGAALITEAIY